ncbi:MAG: TOBE domain-containing protein [Campylobacteraceae bacterium]|jgi:molybdopterin-binding protein|nr:TOBE domain-containing protein [Campylobacteraceae bacterium]
MSQIKAVICDILSSSSINIVRFRHGKQMLAMISLGLKNIKTGDEVILNIKSSHVGIAKNFEGILSFENLLDAKVKEFDKGKMLCVVKLDFEGEILESILTRDTFDKLLLKKGEMVKALILASEISIQKVLP